MCKIWFSVLLLFPFCLWLNSQLLSIAFTCAPNDNTYLFSKQNAGKCQQGRRLVNCKFSAKIQTIYKSFIIFRIKSLFCLFKIIQLVFIYWTTVFSCEKYVSLLKRVKSLACAKQRKLTRRLQELLKWRTV